jgi:tRNA/rRNA methyltransferase
MGAAARAMANFGFSRLVAVTPHAPNWRDARSAVGAPELMEEAVETATLAEAVADCTLVVGTGSLTYRKPEQPVVSLPDLAPLIQQELARGGRIAIVFGPENHGLSREDLSFCHLLIEIPTDTHQPSMNLGQAVAVCLYEVATRASLAAADGAQHLNERKHLAASSADLELLGGVVAETLLAADYSPAVLRDANRYELRLLLLRLAPSARDTRKILGLFRRILWRIKRNRQQPAPSRSGSDLKEE